MTTRHNCGAIMLLSAALALGILACNGDSGTDPPATSTGGHAAGGGGASGGGGAAAGGSSATAQVQVVDPDGKPIADAFVMMGGHSMDLWATTDSEGKTTLKVVDDGVSEPWILAGKVGWLSGGVYVDPAEVPADGVKVTMRPLPKVDNKDYAFQPGGDGSSKDTSECGHCHWTIGDDWAGSAHRRAADNPHTWDLYAGAALGADAAKCTTLGGHQGDGQVPGDKDKTTTRCYVDRGVLPWLNDGCGGVGQQGCDHPDQRDGLEHFGACGDCHSPAIDGATPGKVDLAAAFGVAFEGVTCDFCHKIQSVTAGPSAGLDGGIDLLRPSEETTVVGQVYDPITFGPYPDTIVPIMFGSYAPQYVESSWCGSCHEYAQPALHPSETLVEPARFPNGLPIIESYSEWQTWVGSGTTTCQGCHMKVLDEESSTYDISKTGLKPSVDQGWLRELGQVRHHDFSPAGLAKPSLELTLTQAAGKIEATVTVSNQAAGHAIPTGKPLRQLIVLVTAVDGNNAAVAAAGGQTVPDVGGAMLSGAVGTTAVVNGSAVTFAGKSFATTPAAVRFVRPTGVWDDYEGPGTAFFTNAGLTPQQKGLEKLDFIAEVAVSNAVGDTLNLAQAPPTLQAGDIAYVIGTAHQAGAPGWLYSKVLVGSDARRGVSHYRAVHIASDNRIASGGKGVSVHEFPQPAAMKSIKVTAKLISRRYAAPVADLYGWDVKDEELASAEKSWP